MNKAYRTEEIESDAGTYKIELFSDYDAESPLDWDNEGLAVYVTGRDDLDQLGDSREANALRTWIKDGHDTEGIARRYQLFKAMFGSEWSLAHGTGWGYPSDFWTWYVLADKDWTDPVSAANNLMDIYQHWAQGGFCGFVVTTPNGDFGDSCWGFDSDDAAMYQANDFIEIDAAQRLGQANLVGAGFVGIV
jgi:hypothetical protein